MQNTKKHWMFFFVIFIQLIIVVPLSFHFILNNAINFDEAYFLQAPSSLITQGEYSTSYDGGMLFDPGLTTGPTVLLFVALAFKIYGIGIQQARIIMLIYFGLMITTAYILSCRLFGIISAIITSIFILILPQIFFFGLLVLGEVPAVFYLLLAVFMLAKGKSLLSGLFFGFAILTKNIFALLIISILILWVTDLFLAINSRKLKIHIFYIKLFLGLIAPNLIWEIYKALSLGGFGYSKHIEKLLGVFSVAAGLNNTPSPPVLTRINVLGYPFSYLTPLFVLFLFILAILHNLFILFRENKKAKSWENQERAKFFLIVFSMTVLLWWFSGIHIGWWRHLFPFYIIIMLLIGNSAASLMIYNFRFARKNVIKRDYRTVLCLFLSITTTLFLFIHMILLPIHDQIKRIIPLQHSKLLEAQMLISSKISSITDEGGRIVYWGWWQSPEISFLTQKHFWNIGDNKTRNKINQFSEQGEDIFVLVSPVQKELSPQAWLEENIFIGKLEFEEAGYQLFEYIPSYDWEKQYEHLVARGDIDTLSSYWDLSNPITVNGYYEGFFSDGWITDKAILWLSNNQNYRTLRIKGKYSSAVFDEKSIFVRVYIMDTLIAENELNQSEDFDWDLDLPEFDQQYRALRILIEPSNTFTPKERGINNDGRELSLTIYSISLQ